MRFLEVVRYTIRAPASDKPWDLCLDSIVDGKVSSELVAQVPGESDVVLYLDRSNQKNEIPFVCILGGLTTRGVIDSPMKDASGTGNKSSGVVEDGDCLMFGSRGPANGAPDATNDFEIRVRLNPE